MVNNEVGDQNLYPVAATKTCILTTTPSRFRVCRRLRSVHSNWGCRMRAKDAQGQPAHHAPAQRKDPLCGRDRGRSTQRVDRRGTTRMVSSRNHLSLVSHCSASGKIIFTPFSICFVIFVFSLNFGKLIVLNSDIQTVAANCKKVFKYLFKGNDCFKKTDGREEEGKEKTPTN